MSEQFDIKLADKMIHCSVMYPSTAEFCNNYWTVQPPEIFVKTEQADIDAERVLAEKEDARLALPKTHYSDSYLETLALYRKIIHALLPHNVLLFHGAAIAKDGKAILFTAPSGTGKTTHIRLWYQVFEDKIRVINGDKPLLVFTPQGVTVCGTPWQGKEGYGQNVSMPLHAICALERDTTNHIEKLDIIQALPGLMQQTYHFKEREQVRQMMALIGRLEKVGLYRLGCNMDPEAAVVAERGILHGDL